MKDTREIVIIGSGVAGLSAAISAGRHGYSTTVLTGDVLGGHLLNVRQIEDYPGYPEGVAGYDLCPMMQEQAEIAGAKFVSESAHKVESRGSSWRVLTSDDSEILADALVVATGSEFRKLGVPGEAEYLGLGVSECASCDGPLFRGKRVAVVGGGDSALQEALELANHVDQVLVITSGPELDARTSYVERVRNHERIEVRTDMEVTEIRGDDRVSSIVTVRGSSAEKIEEPVSAVFVYVGLKPRSAVLEGVLTLGEDGGIPTNIDLATEALGVFAAGDVRQGSSNEAISAAGDGATAIKSIHRYFSTLK